MKLYVVVRNDLQPGSQIAQSLHAYREFIEHYRENEERWYSTSNVIVILQCKNEEELKQIMLQASENNLKYKEFREPDMNNEITACTFEPCTKTQEMLQHLHTALKQ